MEEMSRVQQPLLVPTHLDSNPVHDDDTDDDDDNNTIPNQYLLLSQVSIYHVIQLSTCFMTCYYCHFLCYVRLYFTCTF